MFVSVKKQMECPGISSEALLELERENPLTRFRSPMAGWNGSSRDSVRRLRPRRNWRRPWGLWAHYHPLLKVHDVRLQRKRTRSWA